MYLFVRIGDVARKLFDLDAIVEKRERLRLVVTGLQFGATRVDRAAIQSRWCSGFESLKSNV